MPFGIQKPLWMVFGFMHGVGALQWSPGVFDLVVSLCVSGIKKARLHRL